MRDFRMAAYRLVGAVAEVRRNCNTDEFMEHLAKTANRVCELVGEGDAIAYERLSGRFVVVSGVKTNATETGRFPKDNQPKYPD